MESTQTTLADHAKSIAAEWLITNLNHITPVAHYRELGESPQAMLMPILGDGLSPQEISERVGSTLMKLIRDGNHEVTFSYEGTWLATKQRVLVVVHYTAKQETTWVTDIKISEHGNLELTEWHPILVKSGEIHGLFQKALAPLSN